MHFKYVQKNSWALELLVGTENNAKICNQCLSGWLLFCVPSVRLLHEKMFYSLQVVVSRVAVCVCALNLKVAVNEACLAS